VDAILSVANDFLTVKRFVDAGAALSRGRVVHALAAAMDSYVHVLNLLSTLFSTFKSHSIFCIKVYLSVVTQLEQLNSAKELTVNKLNYHLQAASATLSLLISLIDSVEKLKLRGGAVINLVYEKLLLAGYPRFHYDLSFCQTQLMTFLCYAIVTPPRKTYCRLFCAVARRRTSPLSEAG